MRKSFFIFLLFLCILTHNAEARRKPAASKPWIASGGLGLTFDPGLLLITPQLEIKHKRNFFYGPLVQLGLGNATLFTISGSIRMLIGDHPHIKPAVEGAFGIAAASSFGSSSIGLHIMLGMGFDYIVDPKISVGTMVRINFAPPLKTFFASWPLVVGRFQL